MRTEASFPFSCARIFLVGWMALGLSLKSAPPVLVQSVPRGTDLAVKGLARAAETWVDMIRKAQKTIDIEQMYIANTSAGAMEPVLKALEDAGKRGIRIRVILSSKMEKNDPVARDRVKSIAGLEMRILDMGDEGVQHSKFFIVDEREIFLGSQNFDWRALEHIHETGLWMDSPAVAARMKAIFELDWLSCLDPKAAARPVEATLPPLGPEDPEVMASPAARLPKGIPATLPALLESLAQAKEQLRVQLLTYTPLSRSGGYWPLLDNALRAAAVRGVRVQLLVSDWNLSPRHLPHLQSLGLVPNLEIRVASIPEDPSGFIPYARVVHSKFIRVDKDLSILSTSNWSEDYFLHSRNVEWRFRDLKLAVQLDQVFEKLWNSPYCQKLDACKTYPPRQRNQE